MPVNPLTPLPYAAMALSAGRCCTPKVRFRPIADMQERLHHSTMIGFHDHLTNLRSGRPEPHPSWTGEIFITWAVWGTAIILVASAAIYFERWRDIEGTAQMAGGAVLFALAAYLRGRDLNRKREALRRATEAYEDVLRRESR